MPEQDQVTTEVTKSGSTKFQKGHKKLGGRTKGTPNKTTKAVKDFLAELCDDTDIQAAVKKKIAEGDVDGFFKSVAHTIGKPKETKDVNVGLSPGLAKMVELAMERASKKDEGSK